MYVWWSLLRGNLLPTIWRWTMRAVGRGHFYLMCCSPTHLKPTFRVGWVRGESGRYIPWFSSPYLSDPVVLINSFPFNSTTKDLCGRATRLRRCQRSPSWWSSWQVRSRIFRTHRVGPSSIPLRISWRHTQGIALCLFPLQSYCNGRGGVQVLEGEND